MNKNKIITPLPNSTLIVDSDSGVYLQIRDFLIKFSELEKSPKHIHTYKITSVSLWNAAAAGITSQEIIHFLEKYSKQDLPEEVVNNVEKQINNYGKIKLIRKDGKMLLYSDDKKLLRTIKKRKEIKKLLKNNFEINEIYRGKIKIELMKLGYPVEDLCGFEDGELFQIDTKKVIKKSERFEIRDYQREAIDSFSGDGVVVLPCGAGKTIVGIGTIVKLKTSALIICPSQVSVKQWISEIIEKTTVKEKDVGEYTSGNKEIAPITVTTYQMLTFKKEGKFPHLSLFNRRDWGLIIYDEVHLLPAQVFKETANLQAKRRLGMTATFIREDGKEKEIFTLIGPKRYESPWKEIEGKGWIAEAECYEIRVPLEKSLRIEYIKADGKEKYKIASQNPLKYEVVKEIVKKYEGEKILIIGQYIAQLKKITRELNAPLITGKTPNEERIKLYEMFKNDGLKLLVVSKVANFSIDLPDANLAIQISGTFGSRQEEAQRLGRILRPKNGKKAKFCSIVTKNTKDQEMNAKRQLFLTEQGYLYNIVDFKR